MNTQVLRWRVHRLPMSLDYLPWLAIPVVDGVNGDARHFATWKLAVEHIRRAMA